MIDPSDFTLKGALEDAAKLVAPAKNLASPADDKPVNLPSVVLLIAVGPMFQSAILPVDAVSCPSISAPLAINIPSEFTAKLEPNLTKYGLDSEGVKSI